MQRTALLLILSIWQNHWLPTNYIPSVVLSGTGDSAWDKTETGFKEDTLLNCKNKIVDMEKNTHTLSKSLKTAIASWPTSPLAETSTSQLICTLKRHQELILTFSLFKRSRIKGCNPFLASLRYFTSIYFILHLLFLPQILLVLRLNLIYPNSQKSSCLSLLNPGLQV